MNVRNSYFRIYKNWIKYYPLLIELIRRDIKVKYRKSVIGILWSVLNPLFMMMILSVVFSTIFKNEIKNYPIYIFSGQMVYNFFSESTSSSMTAILDNASLIKKVYVPKYLFVLSRVVSSIVNLMSSFCAFIFVMLVLRVDLHYKMILAIVPVIDLWILSVGIGLILAAATVKFRDIKHLYSVFLTAFMYLCPIIYPMSYLPDSVKEIVLMNPLTNILIMFRNVIMYNTIFPVSLVLKVSLEAIILLGVGLYFFKKRQDNFILEM